MLSLLLDRVNSFDSDSLCLSVLKVSLKSLPGCDKFYAASLKSLIVMSEFSTETVFGLFFCIFFFITVLHQFCMILVLDMIYLASLIYFLMMNPLKNDCILMAALVCSSRSIDNFCYYLLYI